MIDHYGGQQARLRRHGAVDLLDRLGVVALTTRVHRMFGPRHLRVVNYHDIPPEHLGRFADHVRFYAQHYDPVNPRELVEFLDGGCDDLCAQRPGLIVTFDDGFHSQIAAADILERYGFVGWYFVPTDAPDVDPDEQEQWAKDHVVVAPSASFRGRRVFASWDELRGIATRHAVGSHTQSHCRFTASIPPATVKRELVGSRDRLTAELGEPPTAFCWVGGELESYGVDGQREIPRAGYRLAFRTTSATVTPRTDPYAIERTNIEADFPIGVVRARMSGMADLWNWPKRRRVRKNVTGRP